jgi:hypothetical protein
MWNMHASFEAAQAFLPAPEIAAGQPCLKREYKILVVEAFSHFS